MRLKFLFFPIILVISVSIFLGYIWPEIDNVKSINEKMLVSNQSLQAIKDKQSAIAAIGNQIDNNPGQEIVMAYLPNKKVEEKIIGGVNYLAATSSVSLVNISLQAQTAAAANNPLAPAPAPAADGSATQSATQLQTTSASITVSGDYDKMRIFLEGLEKMPLYNSIKSLTISKNETVKSAEPADNVASSELAMQINVDFGYLKNVSADPLKLAKLSNNLDTASIDTLNKYISSRAYLNETPTNNSGKANPFLP